MIRQSEPENRDAAFADEASADDARRRLREQGIVSVEPDDRIGVMLAPGERVVAVRRAITIERRTDARSPEHALAGDLYVTTARLVHLGRIRVEIPIADIREAVVAAGSVRLVVGDGRGVEIRTCDPKLLRVEIAAAREAARTEATRLSGPGGRADVLTEPDAVRGPVGREGQPSSR